MLGANHSRLFCRYFLHIAILFTSIFPSLPRNVAKCHSTVFLVISNGMLIKSTFLSSLHYHLCTMFQLTFFVILLMMVTHSQNLWKTKHKNVRILFNYRDMKGYLKWLMKWWSLCWIVTWAEFLNNFSWKFVYTLEFVGWALSFYHQSTFMSNDFTREMTEKRYAKVHTSRNPRSLRNNLIILAFSSHFDIFESIFCLAIASWTLRTLHMGIFNTKFTQIH